MILVEKDSGGESKYSSILCLCGADLPSELLGDSPENVPMQYPGGVRGYTEMSVNIWTFGREVKFFRIPPTLSSSPEWYCQDSARSIIEREERGHTHVETRRWQME
jgi:hypothetical protein